MEQNNVILVTKEEFEQSVEDKIRLTAVKDFLTNHIKKDEDTNCYNFDRMDAYMIDYLAAFLGSDILGGANNG